MNSNSENSKIYFEYFAKFGDTLESIGLKNNLSAELLYNYNNMNEKNIKIGQIIKIPIILLDEVLLNNYFQYKIESEQNLEQISKKFNIPLREISEYNNLEIKCNLDDKIIKVPIKIISHDDNYIEYTMNEFDNLSLISSKYGLSEQEILNYNNLNNEILKDKTIKIPINENNIITGSFEYIIKSGDSLETIGMKYGFTADELKVFNKLNTNNVNPGQIISIPSK